MGCKPDPTNFKIEYIFHVGDCTIIQANYGGATFGGSKLMVLRGRYDRADLPTLDPHFLNEEYPVFARFQPNELGMHLATLVANQVTFAGNQQHE